jgi:hypothetical protein
MGFLTITLVTLVLICFVVALAVGLSERTPSLSSSTCPSCRISSLCGPLLLLAAGVVFSLDLIWHVWSVWKTWPVLLIVIGVCKLAARVAPASDHGTLHSPQNTGAHHAS